MIDSIHATSKQQRLTIIARHRKKDKVQPFPIEIQSTATVEDLAERIIASGSAKNGLPHDYISPTQINIIFSHKSLNHRHNSSLADIGFTAKSSILYSFCSNYKPIIVSIEMNGFKESNVNLGHVQLPCTDYKKQIKHLTKQWLLQNAPNMKDFICKDDRNYVIGFKHNEHSKKRGQRSLVIDINGDGHTRSLAHFNDNLKCRTVEDVNDLFIPKRRAGTPTLPGRQRDIIKEATFQKSGEFHWIFKVDIVEYDVFDNHNQMTFALQSTSCFEPSGCQIIRGDVLLEQMLFYSKDEIRIWEDLSPEYLFQNRDLSDWDIVIWVHAIPSDTTIVLTYDTQSDTS